MRGSWRSRVTSSSASAPSEAGAGLARGGRDRVALIIATVGGVGLTPLAPGTAGSAVAVLVLGLVPFTRGALVLTFVGVTLVGTWAAHHAERALGRKDPGVIVVDEVAGMFLSVLWLPLTVPVVASAFVLFRLFDVVKPFPARASQRLPGGVGVMVDDLVAGLYALGVVALARAVMAWP